MFTNRIWLAKSRHSEHGCFVMVRAVTAAVVGLGLYGFSFTWFSSAREVWCTGDLWPRMLSHPSAELEEGVLMRVSAPQPLAFRQLHTGFSGYFSTVVDVIPGARESWEWKYAFPNSWEWKKGSGNEFPTRRLYGTVIKIWRLKDNGVAILTFQDHVTSSVTWPFNLRWSTSYGWSIATLRLSGTVMEIWRLKIHVHMQAHRRQNDQSLNLFQCSLRSPWLR